MGETELRELMAQMWSSWSARRVEEFNRRLQAHPGLSKQSKAAMGKFCEDVLAERRKKILSLVQ